MSLWDVSAFAKGQIFEHFLFSFTLSVSFEVSLTQYMKFVHSGIIDGCTMQSKDFVLVHYFILSNTY